MVMLLEHGLRLDSVPESLKDEARALQILWRNLEPRMRAFVEKVEALAEEEEDRFQDLELGFP